MFKNQEANTHKNQKDRLLNLEELYVEQRQGQSMSLEETDLVRSEKQERNQPRAASSKPMKVGSLPIIIK